jgi:hypothetical protein
VIFVGHSVLKTQKNLDGEDFDQHVLNAGKSTAGFLRSKCDAMLFAMFETIARGDNDRERKSLRKAFATGRRVLRTSYSGGWVAKCRPAIRDPIPLSWSAFETAREEAFDPDALYTRACELATLVPEEKREAVARAAADARGNSARLVKIVERATELVEEAAAAAAVDNEEEP